MSKESPTELVLSLCKILSLPNQIAGYFLRATKFEAAVNCEDSSPDFMEKSNNISDFAARNQFILWWKTNDDSPILVEVLLLSFFLCSSPSLALPNE